MQRKFDTESMMGGFGTLPGNSPSWLASAAMRARAVNVAHLQVVHPFYLCASVRRTARASHVRKNSSPCGADSLLLFIAIDYQGQAYRLVRIGS